MIGTFSTIISLTLILGLAAMAGMYIEKAGIINLSIEGFMTIGAIIYALMAGKMRDESSSYQFMFLIVAGLATAIFATLYAAITIKFKANQTIAGIALNALALAISVFVIKSKINPDGISDKIAIQSSWFNFADNNTQFGYIFNIVVMVSIPSLIFLWIYLKKTKGGKMIQAVGENPHAAASLGVNVELTQLKAILISGFFTGIAGAFFAQKGSYFFGSTQGIGFLAVAIVIFGQWTPTLILLGALFFGITYGVSETYISIEWLAKLMPKEIIQLAPYALSLGVLVFTSKNSKSPKAIGIPYQNAGR